MFTPMKDILRLADMSYENDNCLDVIFIQGGFAAEPGYLEILKEKPKSIMIEVDWGDPNFIPIYPGGGHVAGYITKEQFDKLDKTKTNIRLGRSLIHDRAYRTFIETMTE